MRDTGKRRVRASGWQLHADTRDMLDHARLDLDQALSERRELSLRERVRLGNRGAPRADEASERMLKKN